jgi:SAM-dependent methyltransferase
MQQPKDLFSGQSAAYRQFRPDYPPALYQYVLEWAGGRERAWDCGTGNGQVAAVLARHFTEVEATDISENQLRQAIQIHNIRYCLSRAESTPFPAQHFDLITVAQALHWFQFELFFAEVQRMMKPGGLLAVWGYGLLRISPEADAVLDRFYSHTLGPYWDAERRHIDSAYSSIPFPFPEIPNVPPFFIDRTWTLPELEGYLGTWSAVQKYIRKKETNPLPLLMQELTPQWKAGEAKPVRFPVFLRLARL